MNKTRLVVLLTIGIFFLSITTIAEEITLTTYYPAPYGEYQQLYVSGNVGIGTASPGSDKLRISSSDAASQLGIWPGGSADNRVWIGTRTANTNLQLGAGVSQAHITILSSGNVGIGTTGPQHELDVNESLRVMGSSVPGGGAGLISGAGLELLYDPLTWPAGTGVIDVIDRSTDGMKDISINAKNIRFGTGLTGDGLGLDRMYINSTGSVGIGTASPFGRATPSDYDSNLTVRGRIYILDNAKNLATAERLQLIHTRTSGSLLNNDELGTLEFFGNSASVATRGVYIVAQADGGTTPTSVPGRLSFVVQRSDGTMVNAVTIKNAGNVGIGTTGPVGKLQVALPNWTNRDNDSQHVIFGLGGDNKGIRFGYNSTSNYGVINVLDPLVAWGNLILQDGGGNVGIGTTSPQTRLAVVGLSSGGGNTLRIVPGTGRIYFDASSQKYKDDIQPLEDDFSKILKIKPKSFVYKTTQERDIGYIAEEFDALELSNLLTYRDGQPDAVKYDKLAVYILEIIKDQQHQIEDLRIKNKELEDKLGILEARKNISALK